MARRRETPHRPELDITLLDEQDLIPRYILYPSDATDEALETTWIRFEDSDSIPLWEAH